MTCALTIAGSDPSGGAGLQADIAVFTRLGVHPMAVPTALTCQNSTGVVAIHPIAPQTVAAQLVALFEDMPPNAIKTGMLGNDEVVIAVAEQLAQHPPQHLVIDPIYYASSGAALLDDVGYAALITHLLPQASLITPNRQEAETLWGQPIHTTDDAARCAVALRDLGPAAVLLTGGHLNGEGDIVDTLADADGLTCWCHPRLPGPSPHGTGCALSAAITAELALGAPLRKAIGRSLEYISNAIAGANLPGAGRPYLGDGRIAPKTTPCR